MDWLDRLAVQGTLKSLFQHHSSKASIPQCSVFFIVYLSHPYMTTGKTIALTRRTFVGKVMSLLFNMLSRPKQIIKLENEVNYNWLRSSSMLWQQYHRLSGLNSKHLFLTVVKAEKSRDQVAGKPCIQWGLGVSFCVLPWEMQRARERKLVCSSSYKSTNLIMRVPPSWPVKSDFMCQLDWVKGCLDNW